MQPIIIKKDKLCVTGLSGDGGNTGKVWEDFEKAYGANPFPKVCEHAYEIRFWDGEKPAQKGMDIHVGLLTKNAVCTADFTTVELPAAEYAVFDVCIAGGYDSGNAEMDKWLADNAAVYKQMELDGVQYIIEVYKDEKFANSVVEFWIPVLRRVHNGQK